MKLSAALLATLAATGSGFHVPGPDAKAGDIVPRSYIATAEGVPCTELRDNIDFLKGQIEGVAQRMAEAPARKFVIAKTCFLSFVGGQALKDKVATMEGVKSIDANRVVATNAPASWGLDRVDQEDLPLDGEEWDFLAAASGVSVYVADTGINKDHVDFGGRAVYGYDAVNENAQTDGNGHGTHCAGTAAGSTFGIAREAKIIGVKVLGASGSGTYEGVIAGIEWCVEDSGGNGVLSMSLGGPSSEPMNEAVRLASEQGMIVVVAGGNDSSDACSKSPAGAGGNGPNGGVITVGSTTDTDELSYFSNYGSCVDILAPGSDITSAWIGSSTATNTISGTSMATPHVAGVAAVCLGITGGNKAAAVECIFDAVAEGKISDPKGSPNFLLQMPAGNLTSAPVTPWPTKAPTTFVPTPAPEAVWTCPQSWYDANDGCDCECGVKDPDCDRPFDQLYCNGRLADPDEICDENLKCVTVPGLTAEDIAGTGRKSDGPQFKAGAPGMPDPVSPAGGIGVPLAVGGSVAFAVLVVGAVVATRQRRRRDSADGPLASKDLEGRVVSPALDR